MSLEDRLLQEMFKVVAESTVQKVAVSLLWERAGTVDPHFATTPGSRELVLRAIDAMVTAQQVRLPVRSNKKAWDLRVTPWLPHWVTKPPSKVPPAELRPRRVWPVELAAAGRACRGDRAALARLSAIADWLRDGRGNDVVPVEERSVQIFGDEKELGRLERQKLFTGGYLTLDLLRCRHMPQPLTSQFVPGVGSCVLLVVENSATYYSCLTVARELEQHTRPDLHVAWGHGAAIEASIESVGWLEPLPDRILYFGDLDVAGLQIAVRLVERAAELGLPAVQPAVELYRWLVSSGTRGGDRSRPADVHDLDRFSRWLPVDIRSEVEAMLIAGRRVAQENLGLRELRLERDLLVALLA